MIDHSDYELIKFTREKDDKQAFQLLYNRYWDKLYSIALMKVYSEEEASDIVQDLFVTIWIRRKELNINIHVDLYLYRALKNRITNYYKKKHLKEEKITELFLNTSGKTESEAEGLCSYKEVELIINKVLESMPDKMRQVFLLSRNDQYSSKKISELLSISDQTVRNQISKAMKRLKIKLEKYRVSG